MKYHRIFDSHLIYGKRIVYYFSDSRGVINGSLIDVARSLGTASDFIRRKIVKKPTHLLDIPISTICWGGPAEIFLMSVVTNRVINMFRPFTENQIQNNFSISDIGMISSELRQHERYEWITNCCQEPINIFYDASHYTSLLPNSNEMVKIKQRIIFRMELIVG